MSCHVQPSLIYMLKFINQQSCVYEQFLTGSRVGAGGVYMCYININKIDSMSENAPVLSRADCMHIIKYKPPFTSFHALLLTFYMCINIGLVWHKGILFSRMDIKHGDCCIRGHYQISMFR